MKDYGRLQRGEQRVHFFLTDAVRCVSAVLFLWIAVLIFFFDGDYSYPVKRYFPVRNYVFVLIVVFFWLLSVIRDWQMNAWEDPDRFDRRIRICTVVLFAAQVFISYNIYFETGWDPGYAIIPGVNALLNGEDINQINGGYFKIYPNNLLLVHIFYLIQKVSQVLGFTWEQAPLMPIIICNCAISSLTCYLIFVIGKQTAGRNAAAVGYGIGCVLFGLSGWKVICYSDSFALFLPILILWLYQKKGVPVVLRWVLMCLLGYLGYLIKPQVLIVLIAIVIGRLLLRKAGYWLRNWKKVLAAVCLCAAVVGSVSFGLNRLYAAGGFEANEESQLSLTHYLMMGFNRETNGAYNQDDVNLSMSIPTARERSKMNLEVFSQRIGSFDPGSLLKFLSNKMLMNVNDGTFSWGAEGGFFEKIGDNVHTGLSETLRSYYYAWGENYLTLFTLEQGFWIAVLILNMAGIFGNQARAEREKWLVIELSIIGILIFELLFESQARYLYIYAPVFILGAMNGMITLGNLSKRCRASLIGKLSEEK